MPFFGKKGSGMVAIDTYCYESANVIGFACPYDKSLFR